jgi:hypothetical protein
MVVSWSSASLIQPCFNAVDVEQTAEGSVPSSPRCSAWLVLLFNDRRYGVLPAESLSVAPW